MFLESSSKRRGQKQSHFEKVLNLGHERKQRRGEGLEEEHFSEKRRCPEKIWKGRKCECSSSSSSRSYNTHCSLSEACALCLNLLCCCVYLHHTLPKLCIRLGACRSFCFIMVCVFLVDCLQYYKDNLGSVGPLLCQASSLKYTLSQELTHTFQIYSENIEDFSSLWTCLSRSGHRLLAQIHSSVCRREIK